MAEDRMEGVVAMGEPAWASTPDYLAYRTVRTGVSELMAGADGNLRVPACPEWTVRDVLGHVVGLSAMAAGRVPPGDPFRTPPIDGSVDELVKLWDECAESTEAKIRSHDRRAMVMDAFTHEVDLRYALGAAVPKQHPAYGSALDVVISGFADAVRALGLPAVRVVCDGREWIAGNGDPVATLTASKHDLHRSFAGRRTHQQIAALEWSHDPQPWLPAFSWGPFVPPEAPVEDPAAV